jgi:hypothetical protein
MVLLMSVLYKTTLLQNHSTLIVCSVLDSV